MSYLTSAAERILPLSTRGDLEIVPVRLDGESCYVVSDPVTLEHFQLTSAESFLLSLLRGQVSLVDLQRAFQQRFPGRRVSFPQLQQFVDRLYAQRLLVSNRPGQGPSLWRQGHALRRRRLAAVATQWLAIRLGGVTAGPWIDRLYRCVGWLFSPIGGAAAAALVLYAMAILATHASDFLADASAALANPWSYGATPWIVALAAVKLWHELGHALACRHFGGECRKIGVLLLAGVPTLYCDVSDVWRLPSKRRRMAVAAGGMAAELLAASASVVVWRHAAPGMLSNLCCSLAIICSAGTLLVNVNPLLRYDGYYLLSDWTEIPNLAERARELVRGAWRHWLLGEPLASDPLLAPRKRRGLWLYAILSRLYLLVLLSGLGVTLVLWARPRGFERLALLLIVVVGVQWGGRRIGALASLLSHPARRAKFRWVRAALLVVALATMGGLAWHWPITRRVTAPMTLVAQGELPLFTTAAGRLAHAAEPGSLVEAGDVVARLVDPEMELAVERQAALARTEQLRCEQLAIRRVALPAAGRELPTALAQREATERQWQQWQFQTERLVVRAATAGRLLAPPRRDGARRDGAHRDGADRSGEKLSAWNGTPLESRNVGAWLAAGTVLGAIAPSETCVAWAAVAPDDIAAVAPGQRVRLIATPQPTSLLTGVVRDVAVRAQQNWPDDHRSLQRATPLGRYHVVEIEVLDPTPGLLPGARGTAKIETYRTTLGELVRRHVSRMLAM